MEFGVPGVAEVRSVDRGCCCGSDVVPEERQVTAQQCIVGSALNYHCCGANPYGKIVNLWNSEAGTIAIYRSSG